MLARGRAVADKSFNPRKTAPRGVHFFSSLTSTGSGLLENDVRRWRVSAAKPSCSKIAQLQNSRHGLLRVGCGSLARGRSLPRHVEPARPPTRQTPYDMFLPHMQFRNASVSRQVSIMTNVRSKDCRASLGVTAGRGPATRTAILPPRRRLAIPPIFSRSIYVFLRIAVFPKCERITNVPSRDGNVSLEASFFSARSLDAQANMPVDKGASGSR